MATINFDTYQYTVYSGRFETASNAAAIHAYDGTTLMASAYFNYDPAVANTAPRFRGTRLVFYYSMSMLDTIVDMLRNEDSVYIFEKVDSGLAYFSTLKEDVGEEET